MDEPKIVSTPPDHGTLSEFPDIPGPLTMTHVHYRQANESHVSITDETGRVLVALSQSGGELHVTLDPSVKVV